jgi:hypothetical protein
MAFVFKLLGQLVGLIPGVAAIIDPKSSSTNQLTTLLNQLIAYGEALAAGLQPPTSIANITADLNLLISQLPPDVASNAEVAVILKNITNTTAGLANLASGNAVPIGSPFSIPTLPGMQFVDFVCEVGGPAYQAIYGSNS